MTIDIDPDELDGIPATPLNPNMQQFFSRSIEATEFLLQLFPLSGDAAGFLHQFTSDLLGIRPVELQS